MTNNLKNPHDKIVKSVLKDTQLAARFFAQHLPKEITRQINLKHIKLEKTSFVDSQLKEYMSDMLYKTTFKNKPCYLYLLLEHQSTHDDLMPFRLLKYSTEIMQQHLSTNKNKKLPVVFPLVYYTGPKTKKVVVRDIFECFEDPIFAKRHFLQPFHLIDLNHITDEDLMKDKIISGLSLIQKHIRDRDLFLIFEKMIQNDIFISMEQYDSEYFFMMLKYTINTGDSKKTQQFLKTLADKMQHQQQPIMTMAQRLRNQGLQEGIEQGIEQGRTQTLGLIAHKLKKQGMPVKDIAKTLSISVNLTHKLLNKPV